MYVNLWVVNKNWFAWVGLYSNHSWPDWGIPCDGAVVEIKRLNLVDDFHNVDQCLTYHLSGQKSKTGEKLQSPQIVEAVVG